MQLGHLVALLIDSGAEGANSLSGPPEPTLSSRHCL